MLVILPLAVSSKPFLALAEGTEMKRIWDSLVSVYSAQMTATGSLVLKEPLSTPNEGRIFDNPSIVFKEPGKGIAFGSRSTEPVGGTGSEPIYLENLFAHWDELLQPQRAQLVEQLLANVEMNLSVNVLKYRLGSLRDWAIRKTYEILDPAIAGDVTYLSGLFNLRGPGPACNAVVASLNFDLTVEMAAKAVGTNLSTGFSSPRADLRRPETWYGSLLETWDCITSTYEVFERFDHSADVELLKPHGSLGWHSVAEGNGDVGWSELLRSNVQSLTFRFPVESLLAADSILDSSGVGGYPCSSGHTISGKAGAIFVKPLLAFAQARKITPAEPLSMILQHFGHHLRTARYLLVVGYGWRDAHINDIIFTQIPQGLRIVNVGYNMEPRDVLALVVGKFPTTHRKVLRQMWHLGGGAKAVLKSGQTRDREQHIVTYELTSLNEEPPPNNCSMEAYALKSASSE